MHRAFDLYISPDSIKSVSVTSDDDWIFEGIASTEDEDLYGEVVYPESFANSIEFFKSNGSIYFNHDYARKNEDWLKNHGFTQEQILSLKMPIGKPLDAQLRDDGLYIKAVLNKKHPLSSFIWEGFVGNEDSRFNDTLGLSIGAKYMGTPRREYNAMKGKYVTYLPELLLYEVSVTPEPVNPHTKTWAYVVKSMMEDQPRDEEISYHTIVPEEVIYDQEANKLIVKSVVKGDSGKTHVFETYIDAEEDIRYLMKKDKKVLKATPDELLADEELLDAEEGVAEEMAEGEDLFGGGEGEELAVEGEVAVEEEGFPGEEGADLADDALGGEADEAVDGLIDSLIGEDSGDEPVEDESQAMILDKLDSILDALQTLAGLGGDEVFDDVNPGEAQVTNEPPVIKAVELSEESTEKFGAAIKGILSEWEERVVDKIVNKLTNETTVVKSVIADKKETVVNPGVALDSSTEADSDIVHKSVVESKEGKLPAEKMDTLKSIVADYVQITGYSQSRSQQRGRLLRRAEEHLGVSQPQFYKYVRKYENNEEF